MHFNPARVAKPNSSLDLLKLVLKIGCLKILLGGLKVQAGDHFPW